LKKLWDDYGFADKDGPFYPKEFDKKWNIFVSLWQAQWKKNEDGKKYYLRRGTNINLASKRFCTTGDMSLENGKDLEYFKEAYKSFFSEKHNMHYGNNALYESPRSLHSGSMSSRNKTQK
jgi:hypothetical protein